MKSILQPTMSYIWRVYHFLGTNLRSMSLDLSEVSLPCSIAQGIQFMHENHVAHRYFFLSTMLSKFPILFLRDCTSQNIVLDPSKMYPKSFHPMVIGVLGGTRGKAKGRGLSVGHGTSILLILAFPGNTIRKMGHL